MITRGEVTQYLSTVDFPASRDDVVHAARQEGAPEAVLKALEAMPPVDYSNREELLRSARTEQAPGEQPAEAAARARDKTHQHIAQHLREP